jgi:DNA-binding transcriptional LysR family regulator
MKTIPFELFEILIQAHESASLTEAAQRLGISQPLVSLKLKELEAYFHEPLFLIEGKRKKLTEFGLKIYATAKESQQKFRFDLENISADAGPSQIRLAGPIPVMTYLISQMKNPPPCHFQSATGAEALRLVQSREVDGALTYLVPDTLDIVAKKVFVSRPHLWIHQSMIVISYGTKTEPLREYCQKHKISYDSLSIAGTCSNWPGVASLIKSLRGMGLVPNFIQNESDEIKVITDIELESWNYYLLYRKDNKKARAFKEML